MIEKAKEFRVITETIEGIREERDGLLQQLKKEQGKLDKLADKFGELINSEKEQVVVSAGEGYIIVVMNRDSYIDVSLVKLHGS